MYSFDGQHKAGLKVSLGGVSKKIDKSALLLSAREERMRRETIRQQQTSAVAVQSWFRGCSARKKLALVKREEYDKSATLLQINPVDPNVLKDLVQKLLTFYKFSQDYQRLITLCQSLLKIISSKRLEQIIKVNIPGWIHRIKSILLLCCKSLCADAEVNISIPLRMLEVFTESKTYNWLGENEAISMSSSITVYIVERGYFKYLRDLVNKRVPNSLEPTTVPPTPFAAAARDLVLKPFRLTSDEAVGNKIRNVQINLVKDILSPSMTEQICYYLVPAIAPAIPLQGLMETIVENIQDYSLWTLYSFLLISQNKLRYLSLTELCRFVSCLRILVRNLQAKNDLKNRDTGSYDSDTDDSDMEVDVSMFQKIPVNPCTRYVEEQCLAWLDEKELISKILSFFNKSEENDKNYNNLVENICDISYHLLYNLRIHVHKSRMLYTFAFHKNLLRACWRQLLSLQTKLPTGKDVQLIQHLAYGQQQLMTLEDESTLNSMLNTFTVLFRYALFSVYDTDFYASSQSSDSTSMMPFSLNEIVGMSRLLREVVIGLISLIYPDVKHNTHLYSEQKWITTCQNVTQLLKQLYSRDTRHRFCPDQHWLSQRTAISQEHLNISSFLDEDEDGAMNARKPGISTINARSLAILKYIPFAIPFLQRVRIFQRIIAEDHNRSRGIEQAVLPSHGLNVAVNRETLYRDAYNQLSEERVSDIRQIIRVQMFNAHGLDEAGIDGGGVFREFMSQLLITGFDPSHGFFKTTSQQLLYPNPDVEKIHPDYLKDLHFIGRMLGKAIYESMMVELPLADFFLCKLLNKHGADVDIYHLESLDPELYKNLLSLKNYHGNLEDLDLNFTVVHNDFGETREVELKPGGRDISVTNSNKIEYIHLMADYRLNKQIRAHCSAFRAGLADVINIEWLQMFDYRELQVLISGAQVPIDIDDLKSNTNYSGGYTAEDPYIQVFWEIISNLTDEQKRLFLKFVTSCSRPPLLGFSELYPKFCIHLSGKEDRLPTASTCMNFLRLPEYDNRTLLQTRIIYAIEAESGFELS